MRSFITFLIGLIFGLLLAAGAIYARAAHVMIAERPSPVGLEATVDRITKAAKAEGWAVQSIIKLEESIKKNGGGDVLPIRLVNLCEAKHAAKMMNVDDARRVSVFMPCTLAVYEKTDGKVYVSSMNAGILGRLFGGVVSEVMGDHVADAQGRFVEAVGSAD